MKEDSEKNEEEVVSGGVHKSVLLNEVIEGLSIKKGDLILDATINGGGHSGEIAERFGDSVTIIGLDEDKKALGRAKKRLSNAGAKFFLDRGNFRDLNNSLDALDIKKINKAIFDLGISSDQLEASGRGFSFKKDEPLLMTLKETPEDFELTAYNVVNDFSEESLEAIIRGFGEEPFAGRIARNIVESREVAPIKTSRELAEIVYKSVPFFKRHGKTHPATRTFQAIRITVNGELDSVKIALPKAWDRLEKGGRMAVISFHSLEDRIVKQYFKDLVTKKEGVLVTKKPIVPSEKEIKENPRSRSSKLRIIEKL